MKNALPCLSDLPVGELALLNYIAAAHRYSISDGDKCFRDKQSQDDIKSLVRKGFVDIQKTRPLKMAAFTKKGVLIVPLTYRYYHLNYDVQQEYYPVIVKKTA